MGLNTRTFMAGKIKTVSELHKLLPRIKKRGKKIALITGCFDILHLGHMQLFRYAKSLADIVIVGLDTDKTISLAKGRNRPVNKITVRCDQLSELESVDYVFPFEKDFDFDDSDADSYHEDIYVKLQPNYLVTNPLADRSWKKKRDRTKKFGIKFIKNVRLRSNASSNIINQILKREL